MNKKYCFLDKETTGEVYPECIFDIIGCTKEDCDYSANEDVTCREECPFWHE